VEFNVNLKGSENFTVEKTDRTLKPVSMASYFLYTVKYTIIIQICAITNVSLVVRLHCEYFSGWSSLTAFCIDVLTTDLITM